MQYNKTYQHMKNNSETLAQNHPSTSNKWDAVAELADLDPSKRQERKAIASLLYGSQYIGEPDVRLPDGAEETALEMMSDGRISPKDERNLLLSIKDPIAFHGIDGVNAKLGNEKHERRILGYAIAGVNGFDNYTSMMGKESITEFIKKYPTPMEFDALGKDLLQRIGEHNTPQKLQEYIGAMTNFKKQIYGKRQEYYDVIKGLHQRIEDKSQTESLSIPTLEQISEHESHETIKHTLIDGDSYRHNGKNYTLFPEHLERFGLAPKQKITIDGVEIMLSDSFECNARDSVIAYVKTKDGYKARSYYRSSSQGVWRYMPDYVKDERTGDDIGWYGKSYNEEAMTLPMELQNSLNSISKKGNIKIDGTDPAFLFAGTAKSYDSMDEYLRRKHLGQLRGDIYQEVSKYPAIELSPTQSYFKTKPEALTIPLNFSPDFSKKLAECEVDTSLYGPLSAKYYLSQNKQLRYCFHEDRFGRAFIGGIEMNSKITSTGLRSDWALAGDIGTPLYEYDSQTGGYGDVNDEKGSYQCMWQGYLSKIPLFKAYKAANSKH